MGCLFRSGRDLGSVYEALVSRRSDWAQHTVDTFGQVADIACGAALQLIEHDNLVLSKVEMFGTGVSRDVRLTPQQIQATGSVLLRALYGRPRTYASVRELLGCMTNAGRELFATYAVADIAGLSVKCSRRLSVGVSWVYEQVYSPSAHEYRLLKQLALHFELAVRHRMVGEVAGTLTPDGQLIEGLGSTTTRLWRALVSGRASLMRAGSGLQRSYRVVENPPWVRLQRALTRDEVTVLEGSAAGEPGKQLGWRLGIAPTTVSRLLASSTHKLGLASPVEGIRIVAGLTRRSPEIDGERLTTAEELVLRHLRTGLSNRQIAEVRGTSDRTVANQVAALLRKSGQPSRRALVAARVA
jgi:DNA-binding NarL/FixJ family response regulator